MQRLEVSGAVRPLYGSLGVKGLMGLCANSQNYMTYYFPHKTVIFSHHNPHYIIRYSVQCTVYSVQ